MRQADGPQAMLVEFIDCVRHQQRVSPFHRLDEAQWCDVRICRIVLKMLLEVRTGANRTQISGTFHRPVPSQMGMCHRVAGGGRSPTKAMIDFTFLSCQ